MPKGLASSAATTLGRHSLVYGAGAVLPFVFGLLNVAVLTRFIAPSEFGQLAVLLVFAASLTILYTLATLQGTFRLVFGGDGEEESDEPDDVPEVSDKGRVLATGIALTALMAGLGTALIALAAAPLTHVMFLDESQAGLVVLAAAGGALGAVWRIVVNIPRLERKPKTYAALNGVRPAFVVVLSVTLVVLGGGVEGVLVGVAVGTALGVVVALVVSRRSVAPAFVMSDVRTILRSGSTLMPIILSAWIVHNLDVYIVAGMASAADAGLYRVGSRVAAIVSLTLGFFMMSWVPLRRTSLFKAVEGQARNGWFNATLATYFFVVCMGLLVVLGVAAQFLVRVAGPSYADAASLVPLLGLGLVAFGCFVVLSRVVKMRRRTGAYMVLAVVSALVFAAAAVLLTPVYGAHGTALAPIVGYGVGIAAMIALGARADGLPAIRWWKIAASALTAGACIAVAALLAPAAGDLAPVVDVAISAAYPLTMLVAGVIEREHLEPLRQVARTVIGRGPEPVGLRGGLADLPPADRSLLESLLRHRQPPSDVAARLAMVEADLHEHLTVALRRLADLPQTGDRDAAIGAYLLSTAPIADRDSMVRRLWSQDVEPSELYALEAAATALMGERVWREESLGATTRSA